MTPIAAASQRASPAAEAGRAAEALPEIRGAT
jgi:hypothetical protein